MENERKKKFCTKCGKPLSEDSNLCSFCDIEEVDASTDDTIYEDINVDAEMISEETGEENLEEADDGLDSDNIQEDEYTEDDIKESTPKVYCRKCGSLVDSDNGICANCGADSNASNSDVTAICWFLGILLLVFIVVIVVYASNLNNTETEDNQSDYDDLQSQISILEDEKNQLQIELDECQSQLVVNEEELNFYRQAAVIVPDDNSKKYHTYSCDKWDYPIWIYNTEAAEGKGYTPCPYCQ